MWRLTDGARKGETSEKGVAWGQCSDAPDDFTTPVTSNVSRAAAADIGVNPRQNGDPSDLISGCANGKMPRGIDKRVGARGGQR